MVILGPGTYHHQPYFTLNLRELNHPSYSEQTGIVWHNSELFGITRNKSEQTGKTLFAGDVYLDLITQMIYHQKINTVTLSSPKSCIVFV